MQGFKYKHTYTDTNIWYESKYMKQKINKNKNKKQTGRITGAQYHSSANLWCIRLLQLLVTSGGIVKEGIRFRGNINTFS